VAISPPSDIVLDVARAVDPTDVAAAREALARRAGGAAPSEPFSLGKAFARPADRPHPTAAADDKDAVKAQQFKRFESMVLQTFIQNMLPKDSEEVYGKGLAGDMWKSQLAEHLADVMADRGGIGIARKMLADYYTEGKHSVPVGPVSNGPQKTETDRQSRLSTSLIHEIQRRIADAMTGDDPASATVRI
jgi:Rod binding domain-containing protein